MSDDVADVAEATDVQRLIEEADAARWRLVSAVAHELRTPLAAIDGYAELLQLGVVGPLTTPQLHHLAIIQGSAQQLRSLVDEVLDNARTAAGDLQIREGSGSACLLAEEAVEGVLPQARARHVRLDARAGGDRQCTFRGDPDRVRQVLTNLLGNAVKFTASGGEVSVECEMLNDPDVGVRLRGPGPWTCWRVRDTAAGIGPEELERIFEEGVQGSAGRRSRTRGSGIGLALSRRLARLMGGEVSVTSEVGAGSVFTFWLPAGEPAAAPQIDDVPLLPPTTGGFGTRELVDVGVWIVQETNGIIGRIVERLRAEVPDAHGDRFTFPQLSNHQTSFISELAIWLESLGDAHPTPSFADAQRIQHLLAVRHGAQRAWLGFGEAGLRLEYDIHQEEVARAIRATPRVPDAVRADAERIARDLIARSTDTAVASLRRVRGE